MVKVITMINGMTEVKDNSVLGQRHLIFSSTAKPLNKILHERLIDMRQNSALVSQMPYHLTPPTPATTTTSYPHTKTYIHTKTHRHCHEQSLKSTILDVQGSL